MIEAFFLILAVILAAGSLTAVVRGRSLGWFVPVWFLVSLAATELAPWVLATQLVTALGIVFFTDLTLGSMQMALTLLMASAMAMLQVLSAHFDSGRTLERALKTGIGDDFEAAIPHVADAS